MLQAPNRYNAQHTRDTTTKLVNNLESVQGYMTPYRPPSKNIPDISILLRVERRRPQIVFRGMHRMTISVVILVTAIAKENGTGLRHVEGIEKSQAPALGLHWRMETKLPPMHHAIVIAPSTTVEMRREGTGKMRR